MAVQTINNGGFDNDGTSEKIRTAFGKVNTMLSEIYVKIPLGLSGEQGKALIVKATEDGFELVDLPGGGDLLAANALSELIATAATARTNLGLGTAATSASSDFATSAQGTKADNALQSVVAGAGVSIDATDPNNPIITNNETNDYVSAAAFAPLTGILTLTLVGGGEVTVNLAAHTVLKIDGFQVKKGSGNTDPDTIEIGDYCRGWDGERDVAFKVNALPHTTESNRDYATNNTISTI